MFKKYILTLCLCLMGTFASAQTPKEIAAEKGKQAVKLEDAGSFSEALTLLAEAQKLDPQSIVYPYESTYCYYNQQHYQQVIDILEKLKDRPDSFDRLYQLLGNSYDELKQPAKAVETYDAGLKRFPKSGCLYLERGVVLVDDKNYDDAIKYFENGIIAQPDFPSNYYWAARIYCNSTEQMWGMIYGELFMNLERNTDRTKEISKLLFDTYKSQITFPAPDKVVVSFSKQVAMDAAKPLKLPYSMVYEPTMGVAAATETAVTMGSLDKIRQNFLKFYTDRGFMTKYPNVLFDYQDKIEKARCMEAYDYWLLSEGDKDTFDAWRKANPVEWENFVKWFTQNPLKLNDNYHFYRTQY